jgi:hypothetical protein
LSLGSWAQLVLVETSNAEKDFEELPCAASAAQLAHACARTGSGGFQADLDSQETIAKEKEGDVETLRDKEVFVARTVEASGQVYAIRNEHGIPMSPQTHEGASQKTGLEGESSWTAKLTPASSL